jgi:phage baseplate assembly protein W
MAIVYSDINLESATIGSRDLVYNVSAIRLNLFNIFYTNPEDRLFMPAFGLNIEALLFEPMDDTTAFYIRNALINGIKQWEPNIVINESQTGVFPDEVNQVYKIVFVYTIPGVAVDTLKFNMANGK